MTQSNPTSSNAAYAGLSPLEQRVARLRTPSGLIMAALTVVYAYTVLRMRMTQEFNKVMPGLPEFCRRLLGVHERKQPVMTEA